MKKIKFFCLLCLLPIASSAAFVKAQGDQFEADELQSIRTVSQAILKVRGQKRREILSETQPLREDMQQISEALEQATAIGHGSIKINQNTVYTSSFSSEKPNSSEKLNSSAVEQLGEWWQSLTKDLSGDNEPEQFSQPASVQLIQLNRAKAIIKKRKVAIEKAQPSFWQLGTSRDEKQVRIQQALIKLENEINELKDEKGEARQEHLRKLISRLNASQEVGDRGKPSVPEPTITSMTKHYRK